MKGCKFYLISGLLALGIAVAVIAQFDASVSFDSPTYVADRTAEVSRGLAITAPLIAFGLFGVFKAAWLWCQSRRAPQIIEIPPPVTEGVISAAQYRRNRDNMRDAFNKNPS